MGNILELRLSDGRREELAELPEDFYGTVTVSFEHSPKVEGPRDMGTLVIKFEHGHKIGIDTVERTAAGHLVAGRQRRGANSLGKGWTDLSTENPKR